MSNQAKFLISILFIAVIILCAGLTRFYFDVTKNTDNTDDEDMVVSVMKKYANGMQVFESKNGYYGLLDSEGAIIIEPEWMEFLAVTDRMAIVSRRIQGEVLIGGVDFEENVILPFAFRSMEKITDHYYIGTVSEDDSCIIFNANFEPMFQNGWNHAKYDNDILILEKDNGRFSYYIAEETPIFRKVQMKCRIGSEELNWNISNRIYLSTLRPDDFIRINSCVSDYIDMLINHDFEKLSEITSDEYIGGLRKMGLFEGLIFDEITDFSFMAENQEEKIYKFSFTINYHKDPNLVPETEIEDETEIQATEVTQAAELDESAQIQLFFKKNSASQLILTSMSLDYHSVQAS